MPIPAFLIEYFNLIRPPGLSLNEIKALLQQNSLLFFQMYIVHWNCSTSPQHFSQYRQAAQGAKICNVQPVVIFIALQQMPAEMMIQFYLT